LQGFATLAFELIQNADDALGATRITFTVQDAIKMVEWLRCSFIPTFQV
jgi:hypothetical protein